MDEEARNIIIKFRGFLEKHQPGSYIVPGDFYRQAGLSEASVRKHFPTDENLVEKVLAFERANFEVIFLNHDFEGVNAIDILMTVSKEVADNFKSISPSVTFALQRQYPEIYKHHFASRRDFIYDKIKINLTKGINQGMYRDDLSIELIARLYLSRLSDLHNPDFFPPEQFSFETLFLAMFDNFVRSIAKPEGLAYYEKKKKQLPL